MKVLYLFLPVHPKCNTIGMRSMPPLALYYLVTILEDNGIEVDIVDPSIISRSQYFDTNVEAKKFIGNLFDNKEYDAILFSATTGNWGVTKEMIQQIHEEFPNIPICVGGIHVSYFARYIITGMPYLIALKGEGEKNIVSVIQNVKNYNELKKIPNIVFYDGEQVVETVKNELMEIKELQEIKNVDYSKVPKNSYGCIGLETSRGCRFRCVFCSVLYKHIWRGLTEQYVVNNIMSQVETIKEKTKSNYAKIYFVDDCFTADVKRAKNILNLLSKKSLDLRISFEARVTDLMQVGFLENIPEKIIDNIQIGVEAGYNEGLKKVRKGITIAQLEECAEHLYELDLQDKAFFSFIIGFPWETITEIKSTISTAAYLYDNFKILANINWLWLMPSDLWDERQNYGIEVNESIFDDPLWFINREYFMETHPNIEIKDIRAVEELIKYYANKGIRLAYTGVLFDLE